MTPMEIREARKICYGNRTTWRVNKVHDTGNLYYRYYSVTHSLHWNMAEIFSNAHGSYFQHILNLTFDSHSTKPSSISLLSSG